MRVNSAHRISERFFFLTLLVVSVSTHGQQTTAETPMTFDEKAALSVLEKIVLERMIIPGKGLTVAAIGTELTALSRSLGQPAKQGKTGKRNKDLLLQYLLDDGTQLVVTGRGTVQRLNLIGNATSSYITSEGVTFGMQSQRVATVYGPAEVTKSTLVYDQIGIAFRFKDDELAEILIAPPGELSKKKKK